ncbi:MAG: hypothetical protein H0X31_11645 [Nostocaceae cyanobacterium]|nr:hypothetical protein [Nostocaceae cyanobacterium]
MITDNLNSASTIPNSPIEHNCIVEKNILKDDIRSIFEVVFSLKTYEIIGESIPSDEEMAHQERGIPLLFIARNNQRDMVLELL